MSLTRIFDAQMIHCLYDVVTTVFGLGWFGLALGCVGFGLAWPWVGLALAWVGLGLVWVGFRCKQFQPQLQFLETNLMHFSPPWMGGRQLQDQLRTF